tara:strand:- start:273 stop:1490 length:1218 start_codon:yes stop_codon:yes gene_type:complete
MKITDLQETKNFVFSQPTRQTALMIFVLLCVFFIAYLLFPAVAPIFLSSPYLNGVIIGVFILGVLACFWQVFILVSSVYWIEGFVSERPGHEIAKPPRILAPLEALLRDKQSRRNINPLSARSILDSVATRLDEVRDITRYIINLLIFLGLLGTFYGLATTVPAVVETIKSLAPKEGQTGLEVFEGLMVGLESQLGGMGTAFASSLLGLAGSLVVGLLELFAGHGQNRFYMELEEWLSSISKIGQSFYETESPNAPISSSELVINSFENKLNHLIELLENNGNQSFNNQIQINELTKSIEKLILNEKKVSNSSSDHGVYNQTDLNTLINNQDNLVNLIRNFVEIEKNSENEFRSRVRNMDVQLAKIFNELKTGRQDNLSELREDFTILSNAIIRLSNSNNNNKPE